MAKLKIFTEITAASWDILKDWQKNADINAEGNKVLSKTRLINRIENLDSEINLLQVEREWPNKIQRTYCTCGNVEASLHDSCPVCGNKSLVKMTVNGTSRESFATTIKNSGVMPLKLYSTEWYVDSIGDEFIFIKGDETLDASIHKNFADFKNKNANLHSLEEIKKLYTYDLTGFDKYYKKSNIDDLCSFINDRDDFPVLVENINKYPNIVNHILASQKGKDPFKLIKSFDEVFKLLNSPEEKLNPYLNKIYRTGSYYYYYRSSGSEVLTNLFEPLTRFKTDELKESIYFIIIHGQNVSASDIQDILRDIESLSLSIDEEKMLSNFIRAQYILHGNQIIKNFSAKRNFLKSKGYDVSDMNLDIRNHNIIKNVELITEQKKYNKEKTSYFLELFDLNPLESLSALDSRRAPNKAERAALAELLG